MESLAIRPLEAPPSATVSLPGSKSVTNRALVTAALAEGTSAYAQVMKCSRGKGTRAVYSSFPRAMAPEYAVTTRAPRAFRSPNLGSCTP